MGIFSKIFGGESTKGIKYQRAENEVMRDFASRQASTGRQDINRLFPQAYERFNEGLNQAQGTIRSLPNAQIDPLQQASMQAQESILGGMDAYRAAILGLAPPPQMAPQNLDTQSALMPFQAPPVQESPAPQQAPRFNPRDFAQMLSGAYGVTHRW